MPIQRRTVQPRRTLHRPQSVEPYCCRAQYWCRRLKGYRTYVVSEGKEYLAPGMQRRIEYDDGSKLYHVFTDNKMFWTLGARMGTT